MVVILKQYGPEIPSEVQEPRLCGESGSFFEIFLLIPLSRECLRSFVLPSRILFYCLTLVRSVVLASHDSLWSLAVFSSRLFILQCSQLILHDLLNLS